MFLTSYKEARELILEAQNPLFLYDNDSDGLCSFVIMRKFLGRGEGVAVKSYPDLSEQYLSKVDSLGCDFVIVLDIHAVSSDFLEGIKERGLGIIWIDHHQVDNIEMRRDSDFIYYYNPLYTIKEEKNSHPVSYLSYKISKLESALWISYIGCISDCFLPEYSKKILDKYEDIGKKKLKTAFDVYYNTEIGRIALMLNFALKDKPSKVKELQEYLVNCSNPADILDSGEYNPVISEHSSKMYKKYIDLVESALENIEGNSIFFIYSGDLSISSEISNALIYRNPKKYVAVAYKRQGITNISLRGKNVKKILDSILLKIPNSKGGGHNDAVGARISAKDVDLFKSLFLEETERFK